MALTPFALGLIAPYLRGDVLALGYPDLLMTPAEAARILGRPVPATATEFGARHKLAIPLAETGAVFAALGVRLRCVDLRPSRGVEDSVDLNLPQYLGLFDLVIDAGTIEHCANIGQALLNAAGAVRPGGYVFHSPPLSMANHGYYGVHPALLVDFYQHNGWDVRHLSGFCVRPPYDPVVVHPRQRFAPPAGTALYFLAQRTDDRALSWPT